MKAELEHYEVAADNFPHALARVAAQFQIPMGIEWISTPATQREIKRSWRSSTVYEVMKSLIKNQAGYDFIIKHGVVDVFPRGAPTDKSDFLNHRVPKFGAHNEFGRIVSNRLREVMRRTISPVPTPGTGVGFAGSSAVGIGDKQVSFALMNASAREILDRLILATDYKIWIVTYPENRTLTKTGFLRVASFYSDIPVPDEQQPVWTFLRWQDALGK